jgi:peptidoglycan L-alanyl-D-glutamate endopeptidase CwlK
MPKIDTLDPSFRPVADEFLAALEQEGIKVGVVQARRTIAEQNAIYAQGRTTPGNIVSNAKGGQSPHNYGHALDVCPYNAAGNLDWNAPAAVWNRIGEIGKQCGLVWGGDFRSIKDLPHFESTTWKTLRAAWQRGELTVA